MASSIASEHSLKWLRHLTQWDGLSKFGNNQLVRRSYYWLFLTPVAVKFEVIAERVYSEMFGSTLDVSLPFSWYVLFFSALSFTIGVIVFSYRCPVIVKSFSSYSEFLNEGRPSFGIWELTQDLSLAKRNRLREKFDVIKGDYDTEKEGPRINFSTRNRSEELRDIGNVPLLFGGSGIPHAVSEVFYAINSEARDDYVAWRYICFSFFLVGFGLFMELLVQNIMFVIGHVFRSLLVGG